MKVSTSAGNVQEASIRATILNADGTVKEELGIISYYHKNPLKRLLWWLSRKAQKWER